MKPKELLIKLIPEMIFRRLGYYRNYYLDGHAFKSYSQEGEDMIIRSLFNDKIENGFYVDIGAYDPKRFSNTYFFYKNGWRGINIDATRGSMNLFNKFRPRDINLELLISDQVGEVSFYMFAEFAFNTFDKELALKRELQGNKILEIKQTRAVTLKEVLEKYVCQPIKIDFLTIDVEGVEMQVLKSNDWERFKPLVIVCESLDIKEISDNIRDNVICQYLLSKNYLLIAKTPRSLIFKLKSSNI